MYILYYSPGSCSLIVHCLLEEFGVPFELKRVDAASKDEYRKLNPKGKVPALATPDGVLTECVAIVQYLCDLHVDAHLLANPGPPHHPSHHSPSAPPPPDAHPP